MAFSRNAGTHNSWFQEQQSLVNGASESELMGLRDTFDNRLEDTVGTMQSRMGVNVMKDVKKMLEDKNVMMEYKTLLLDPILDELRNTASEADSSEKFHLESVASQLEEAWDTSVKSFMVQESYNVSNYLPLSTLDFPALIKQYIRFLGKDIIPVQTASSVNIEQRIFIKYLVNNQTGEEYETPAIYFQKDDNGQPLWKKLWNAGKGLRLNDKDVLTLSTIQAATNKKYSLFNWLLGDDDQPTTITPNVRTRISYDFGIQYVQIDGKKVRLPHGGIQIDIQTGGVFLNGGITSDMKLAVVDENGKTTGEVVTGVADRLSGVIDFIKGTITATSCGSITGIYVSGHVSNETNLRTIGFREYPEIRKFQIADGVRFQLPFTVEDFAEANSSLNFNLYNRLVQELITAQEMFEDEYILQFLDEEFNKYDGAESDIWALESYTATEYVDLDPTAISPSFAGDPFEYRTNIIHNGIASLIYELCDRGKLDNLGFVVYANPKAARLLQKFVTWTVKKSTEIGGVLMNHAFGVLTDTDIPIRVVASNRVDAYINIEPYQDGAQEGDVSREYFYKIVAYPMDKFHISYKHLRFARHLTNSPENAAYADAQNPGGAAVLVTTSSQYRTIAIQGIQARLICKNTVLVPDSNAGLVSGGDTPTPPVDPTEGYTVTTEEPANWATTYGNYWKVNAAGTAMEAVTAVAPEFDTTKFYFTAATGGEAIQTKPADWDTTYSTYYVATTEEGERTAVTGVAPTWAANTYYTKNA
jgi:hypothetical protein